MKYREHEIEKNEWNYWVAYDLNDCDAYMLFDKSIFKLIDQINDKIDYDA